jgi:septal ring factor EnvC (AmiA/AmiB activator)
MFSEFHEALTIATVAAFVAGWIVAKFGSYVSRKLKARHQDPRDSRIRSLEADVRVAQTAADKAKSHFEQTSGEVSQLRKALKERDAALAKQESTIERLRTDLRDSVKKTRELREELTLRATENVRSEVKLREVETELSLVHASTDLLATGMLDYLNPEADEDDVQIFKAGG